MLIEAESSYDENFQKRILAPSDNCGSMTLTGISNAFPGFIFYIDQYLLLSLQILGCFGSSSPPKE